MIRICIILGKTLLSINSMSTLMTKILDKIRFIIYLFKYILEWDVHVNIEVYFR